MSMLKIKIEDLNTRDLQTRAALNEDTVSDYAEAMERGERFPAVTIFTDGAEYYLADGFHRVEALRRIGKKSVMAELQDGDYKAALLYALKANSTHGLRRTNADKRHALEMAWNAREHLFGGEPSDALLADVCGVTRLTVRNWKTTTGCINYTPCEGEQGVTMLQGEGTSGMDNVQTCAPSMPSMPVRPSAPISAENVAKNAPKMPIRRIGRDGKSYTVQPMPTRTEKSAHVVPTDRYGTEIPVGMNGAFDDGQLSEIASLISRARVALRNGIDAGAPSFAAVRQEALVQLNNAYSFVTSAKAHCVCRMCQGNGCKACHNRGWQTEEEYERNPKEFKA